MTLYLDENLPIALTQRFLCHMRAAKLLCKRVSGIFHGQVTRLRCADQSFSFCKYSSIFAPMLREDKEKNIVKPFENELPSAYADRLGVQYSSIVSNVHKKDIGQFFTPRIIAKFMGEFAISNSESVKILDPGCGIGILSTAMTEDFILINPRIKTIELVAFENDVDILPYTELCFTYLKKWLESKDIELIYFLCKNDFILHNSQILAGKESSHEQYDIIVSNPPYFKLPKQDSRALAAKAVIYGQTNIYSIFLLLSAKLLKPGGKLIFITPRSFCSGNYFRMFREQFFNLIDISNIHLFDSRSKAFKRDKVLQETLIMAGTAKTNILPQQLNLPFDLANNKRVLISKSAGLSDLNQRSWMFYPLASLVDMASYQKTLHLPSSTEDDDVIKIFRSWNMTLHKLGWEISTGKIVDFRSKDFIVDQESQDTVPLFWLHNIRSMHYNWPDRENIKGKSKGQFYISTNESGKTLIPNKNYILLRRFSSKDDLKKLIAAPYLSDMLPQYSKLGIENHLNYIYKKEGSLSCTETLGLAALLNSELFDRYFRTFNGNINVSATELREITLPDIKIINEIGEIILNTNKKIKIDIDQIVSDHLNLNKSR